MNLDKIIDNRDKKCETGNAGTIKFLGGRPVRETVISPDDILNLKILLNTTEDIDSFINDSSLVMH